MPEPAALPLDAARPAPAGATPAARDPWLGLVAVARPETATRPAEETTR